MVDEPTKGKRTNKPSPQKRGCILACQLGMGVLVLAPPLSLAQEVYSVHNYKNESRLVVEGVDLNLVSGATLGGVSVPFNILNPDTLEIPYGTEVYSAISWTGTYNLVLDGSVIVSVYIDEPIIAPPPPPPPGGPDCPCITGWSSSEIPQNNSLWCINGQDGTQSYIFAANDVWTISAAFDPEDIFFDEESPGNSVSYCVLIDNGSYSVAEPVVNTDQYSDCEDWIWQKICI